MVLYLISRAAVGPTRRGVMRFDEERFTPRGENDVICMTQVQRTYS